MAGFPAGLSIETVQQTFSEHLWVSTLLGSQETK